MDDSHRVFERRQCALMLVSATEGLICELPKAGRRSTIEDLR